MTPRYRYTAARLAYIGVILIAALSGLQFTPDLAAAADRLGRAFAPSVGWRDAIDAVRNLALFAGLGALWVVTSSEGNVRSDIRRAAIAGFAMSIFVEALQLFSPVRQASILDLASNTAGAFLGAVAIAVLAARVSAARQAPSYFGLPASLLAGAYALAALCEAITPLFGSVPIPGADGGPLRRMGFALAFARPLSITQVSLTDGLLFAPAGFLVVVMLGEMRQLARWAWLPVAVGLAALLACAEIGHGMLGIPVRFEAAGVDFLAVLGGALAARRWVGRMSRELRGAARARAFIATYVVLLALWGWRPFLPKLSAASIREQITLDRFIPLASLSGRDDVFSALHVVQIFWLYAVLGAILAVWPLRLRGALSHLWPALWAALAIEVGHLAVANRFFDMTNVMVAAAGAAIAWIIVRRCGFVPHGEAWPRRR